eukprot:15477571-Alexandrium_andersonii.AAC.1
MAGLQVKAKPAAADGGGKAKGKAPPPPPKSASPAAPPPKSAVEGEAEPKAEVVTQSKSQPTKKRPPPIETDIGDVSMEPAAASVPADGGEADVSLEPAEEDDERPEEVLAKPSVMMAPPGELCHPDAPGGKPNIPRRRFVEKQKPNK